MPTSAWPAARVESQDQLDPRSDAQLIAAINAGDATAFEVLYFRHRDWVVNLGRRFTGSDDLALDVMQETFLYFLKKFPGFRLSAHLKTFLYPAVRNLSIAARRKAQRYQSGETEQNILANLPATTTTHVSGDLAVVLVSLSEDHREVLLLRFVDGLSLAEIAGATSVPLGTVKSRLHNALETLRQNPGAKEFFAP